MNELDLNGWMEVDLFRIFGWRMGFGQFGWKWAQKRPKGFWSIIGPARGFGPQKTKPQSKGIHWDLFAFLGPHFAISKCGRVLCVSAGVHLARDFALPLFGVIFPLIFGSSFALPSLGAD